MNGRHVFPQTYQVSCYAQTEILVTFETPFDLCAGVYFLRSCMRAFIQLPSLPLCCNGGRQFWYQVSWRRSRSALKSENPFCFDRVVSLIASLKTEEKETSLHLLLLLSSKCHECSSEKARTDILCSGIHISLAQTHGFS